MAKILERFPADPPHPLSIKVKLDCGHEYTVHGRLASEYNSNDIIDCELCRLEKKA